MLTSFASKINIMFSQKEFVTNWGISWQLIANKKQNKKHKKCVQE